MVQTARGAGKSVILSGLWPVKPREDDPEEYKAATPAQIAQFNTAIAQLAVEESVPWVDMVAALGGGFMGYLSPDGLHPNEAGYQRMAEIIANAVVAHFGRP